MQRFVAIISRFHSCASAGIGRGVLIPGNLALQAQGPPACFTAEYICLVDVPYLLVTWSFIVLVRDLQLVTLICPVANCFPSYLQGAPRPGPDLIQ